ncbi:MAG: GNAT family N-acetyltransferase [Acidobacteria bacterium]|jgi:putative hemolysin|nr:MAG: GNAT family N-acetyltransferase [Acidobacteriota bacterium]GIU81422.1 MAG: hemolysin [Pyrinomonadaceae bacterium]
MISLGRTIYRAFAPRIQAKLQHSFRYFQRRIPRQEISEGRYIVRFARDSKEVEKALRLRFEVFNLELKEGLQSSYLTGRDEDEFDSTCHHLIAIDKASNCVVGTYRLRTIEMAKGADGFYSSQEFSLENLPLEVLEQSVEIGRACIAREHRNSKVLFLLWKGLALYLTLKRKRYFFGCCSLASQDCAEGLRVYDYLVKAGHFHPYLRVFPRAGYVCKTDEILTDELLTDETVELPKLFRTYLRIGARVCSEPAIDRYFKTIDFFVLFDVKEIDQRYYQMFFSDAGTRQF